MLRPSPNYGTQQLPNDDDDDDDDDELYNRNIFPYGLKHWESDMFGCGDVFFKKNYC